MFYLLQELPLWAIAAFALGLVAGAATCGGERPGARAGWPLLALFLYLFGAAAAFLKLLPGRAGLWLETALLLGGAYFAGCVLGCLLHRLFAARPAEEKPALQAREPAAGPEAAPSASMAEPAEALESGRTALAQKTLANDNVDAASAGTGVPLASLLVEGAKSIEGQAAALAAATPLALAAAGEAQKILTGGESAEGAKTETPPQAPSVELADGAKDLADHAAALATATPLALAAADEAQKILTGGEGGAGSKTEPPPPPAPSVELADGAKNLADHAASLAAATPLALAAAGEAQKILTGGESGAGSKTEPPPPPAPSVELADGAKNLADHAAALAAATPLALAAAGEAQKLLAGGEGGAGAKAETASAASGALADGAQNLADHAAALAAATPLALAAAGEAQKLLAGDESASPAKAETAPAASGGLADGAKNLADHAAALAAATPQALAAASEAQKFLAGGESASGAKAATIPAASSELADGAQNLADHAAALATATPLALAAADEAQVLLSKSEPLSPSAPPAMARPSREKDEDKLGQIEGVGRKLTRKLNEMGVWRFEQIAAWTPEQAAWVGAEIGEPGRVESENWIAQARLLAARSKSATPGGAGGAGAPPSASAPERPEEADDLRLIRGVGDKIAGELHDLGVWRFSQIAAWTPEQQDWIGEKLGHSGPVARNYWVAQARLLAAGVDTDHSRVLRASGAAPEAANPPLDEAAAAALHASLPEVIAPHANDEIYAGVRPLSLLQPPNGEMDDLAAIEGVGAKLTDKLHALGVWTFAQIALWSDENARWIGSYLAFPGRVQRENWVGQARRLAATKKSPG